MSSSQQIKAVIVGGTGYTGVELLRLLLPHPSVELIAITGRSEAGTRVDSVYPSLRGACDLSFIHPNDVDWQQVDVAFLATPNGIAMRMTPELLEQGVRVIDLSADFRLQNISEYEQWYGESHLATDALSGAVYGLTEWQREAVGQANVIANPGCYPTAVQLPLLPLVAQGLISGDVVADCKSGVSGAGRGANVGTLLCEASESFKAYGVGGHRHLPEIQQGLRAQDQDGLLEDVVFTPHLVPMIRGIQATLHVRSSHSIDELYAVLRERYQDEAFVDVLPLGETPDTRSVKGTNVCRIGLVQAHGTQGRFVICSVIDNLVKGAAGQAVQNMNAMFSLPETQGLAMLALVP